MSENISNQLRMTVYASLFASLIAAGSFIALPVGPAPIVLQNLFVMLAGLLLGAEWGAAATAIYLSAGILGLPVFAGGMGGIGRIIGPTGGYLLSYLPAAWLTGFISRKLGERSAKRTIADLTAMICGSVVVYAGGIPWLKMILGLDWPKAFALGLYPFLPGDILKIAVAVPIARALRPIIEKDAN